MNDKWRENLEIKINNQVDRIGEIDLKIQRLRRTREQLLSDLQKNQVLLEQGPEGPKPKKKIKLSEDYRAKVIQESKSFQPSSHFQK